MPFVQRAVVALRAFRGVDLRELARGRGLARLDAWMDAVLARPSALQTVPEDEVIVASWGKFVMPLKEGAKL